ncbi:MAG: hypothetical protein KC910_02265 [Candidatus Eremiobacteraeota bacterium]|nr:hypothetical protein [Candidatus Eremiobacteraeota bacterium]
MKVGGAGGAQKAAAQKPKKGQQAGGGGGGGGEEQQQKADEKKQMGEALVSQAIEGTNKMFDASMKTSSACTGLGGGGEAGPVGGKIEGLKGSAPPPGAGGAGGPGGAGGMGEMGGMGGPGAMGGMGGGGPVDSFMGTPSPIANEMPSLGGQAAAQGIGQNFAGAPF